MKGRKIRQTIHTARRPPDISRSRKMSPTIENSTIRYDTKMMIVSVYQKMLPRFDQNSGIG